jgi:hypothetical protein
MLIVSRPVFANCIYIFRSLKSVLYQIKYFTLFGNNYILKLYFNLKGFMQGILITKKAKYLLLKIQDFISIVHHAVINFLRNLLCSVAEQPESEARGDDAAGGKESRSSSCWAESLIDALSLRRAMCARPSTQTPCQSAASHY